MRHLPIAELNAQRETKLARSRAILDASDASKKPLTRSEHTELQQNERDVHRLNAELRDRGARIERGEAMGAAEAVFVSLDRNGNPRYQHAGNGARVNDTRSKVGRSLVDAIDQVRSGKLVTAYVNPQTGDATDVQSELRTLTGGGSGGALVENELLAPVLSLRPTSVVLGLPGLQVIHATSDRVRLPKIGAVDIAAIGEAVETSDSDDPDLDLVDIVPVKFGAYQSLSSEVIEDATPDVLGIIGTNLLSSLAIRVDLGFLQGNGASDCVGIRNTIGVSTTSVAATLSSLDDLHDALYAVENANASAKAWVMHPRSWNSLAKLKTGLSGDERGLIEPDAQQSTGDTLLGLPVVKSTQVTITEGGSSNGSWIAAVDPAQLVAVIRRPALLEVSRDVAFRSDEVVIRATTRVGFGALNAPGVSILADVRTS